MGAIVRSQALDGARNLLLNCAGLRAGDRLLILHEDPALGWYDDEAPSFVAEVARELGARVRLRQVGGPSNEFKEEGAVIDADCDCCLFFARIGDQLRFDKLINLENATHVAQLPIGSRRVCAGVVAGDAALGDHRIGHRHPHPPLAILLDVTRVDSGRISNEKFPGRPLEVVELTLSAVRKRKIAVQVNPGVLRGEQCAHVMDQRRRQRYGSRIGLVVE